MYVIMAPCWSSTHINELIGSISRTAHIPMGHIHGNPGAKCWALSLEEQQHSHKQEEMTLFSNQRVQSIGSRGSLSSPQGW